MPKPTCSEIATLCMLAGAKNYLIYAGLGSLDSKGSESVPGIANAPCRTFWMDFSYENLADWCPFMQHMSDLGYVPQIHEYTKPSNGESTLFFRESNKLMANYINPLTEQLES